MEPSDLARRIGRHAAVLLLNSGTNITTNTLEILEGKHDEKRMMRVLMEGIEDELRGTHQPPGDPDLRAARSLVAERYDDPAVCGSAIIATINGEDDETAAVQNALKAVKRGRELELREQMMAAPVARTRPDRLTITVDGPQGSGKTTLEHELKLLFPKIHRYPGCASAGVALDPAIIVLRDN